MKHIFLSIFFSFVSLIAISQTILIADSMPVKGKLSFNLYESLTPVNKTEMGLLYRLPIDGMPALRPDTNIHYNMPVVRNSKNAFYTTPSIRNFNPLFLLDKEGEKFIITPEGPKRIKIH
jgi:hypothetical protein